MGRGGGGVFCAAGGWGIREVCPTNMVSGLSHRAPVYQCLSAPLTMAHAHVNPGMAPGALHRQNHSRKRNVSTPDLTSYNKWLHFQFAALFVISRRWA